MSKKHMVQYDIFCLIVLSDT